MGAGLGEGSFEVGAFGGSARGLVAEGADQLPVFLAVDVGAQSGGLGFEGVRLVGLVGRDPGVGGDLHGWTSLCGLESGSRRRPRSPPTVKARRRAHRTSSRRPSAPRPVTRAFAVARRQRRGGKERRQEVGEGDEGPLFVLGVEGHLDGWQHHELVLSVGAPPWPDAAPSGCHYRRLQTNKSSCAVTSRGTPRARALRTASSAKNDDRGMSWSPRSPARRATLRS